MSICRQSPPDTEGWSQSLGRLTLHSHFQLHRTPTLFKGQLSESPVCCPAPRSAHSLHCWSCLTLTCSSALLWAWDQTNFFFNQGSLKEIWPFNHRLSYWLKICHGVFSKAITSQYIILTFGYASGPYLQRFELNSLGCDLDSGNFKSFFASHPEWNNCFQDTGHRIREGSELWANGNKWGETYNFPKLPVLRVFKLWCREGEPRWNPADSLSWADRAESLETKEVELAEHLGEGGYTERTLEIYHVFSGVLTSTWCGETIWGLRKYLLKGWEVRCSSHKGLGIVPEPASQTWKPPDS